MSEPRYLVGLGTTPYPDNGLPARLTVVFFEKLSWANQIQPDSPYILVEIWRNGVSVGPTSTPEEILEHRPHILSKTSTGKTHYEQEPPGWFERKCAEANCSWFVPLVKRMAAGEKVPLSEIQAEYRNHNAEKELPCGLMGEVFF